MARIIKIDDKEYTILDEATAKLPVYFHTGFEDLKGVLSDINGKHATEVYCKLHPCTCGSTDIELHEFEYMGDGSYSIKCNKCGKNFERDAYDVDINSWEELLPKLIEDWNNGRTTEDVKAMNEKEHKRKALVPEDLHWEPIYPNNMPENHQEGEYCILNRKTDDGSNYYVCKWSILYQLEELEPMVEASDAAVESYNLFLYRNTDALFPMEYSVEEEDRAMVNEQGNFVRSYRTLEEAKQGALARCGWQRLNKDTILDEKERKNDA